MLAEPRSLPSTLKVAHVLLSLDVGGLERLVIDLVREGKRLGQEPSVVCLERKGALAFQAESSGARVYCVDKPDGLSYATMERLTRLFRDIRPNVVHSHQIGALFYAGGTARRTGVAAVVHTEHGKHYAQRFRTRWLGRWAGHYADKFCCVSADIADEVRRLRVVPPAKIQLVANGIDVERFAGEGSVFGVQGSGAKPESRRLREELGIPAGAPVLGTIGRLNEIKRQDLLIRAFARLAQRCPDAHLVIVGDGPLRGELECLASSAAPAGHVHFAGYQPEPERWLRLMDVFALTSRSEGMPLSILEAWGAGVPVVSSAVGGVPELIADGETGLLFPSGDDAALAGCFNRMLGDQTLCKRLADAGRERVNHQFSLANTAEVYHRLYQEIYERQTAMARVCENK